jgi:hypothetical protein
VAGAALTLRSGHPSVADTSHLESAQTGLRVISVIRLHKLAAVEPSVVAVAAGASARSRGPRSIAAGVLFAACGHAMICFFRVM